MTNGGRASERTPVVAGRRCRRDGAPSFDPGMRPGRPRHQRLLNVSAIVRPITVALATS